MGRVRLDLVLEDIDSLAADVAARHLSGTAQQFGVVTASMDRLQLVTHEQHVQQLLSDDGGQQRHAVVEPPAGSAGDQSSGGPLLIDNDLRLAGCVAWVGRSSLEVTIELADHPAAPAHYSAADKTCSNGGDGGGWRRRGVAHFVMVVRSADPAVAVGISPLLPATPLEHELCRQAALRNEERKLKRQSSGGSAAPKQQELIASAQQQRAERAYNKDTQHAVGAVPMGSTSLQAPVIMHHQDRNVTEAVFGGHVSIRGLSCPACRHTASA